MVLHQWLVFSLYMRNSLPANLSCSEKLLFVFLILPVFFGIIYYDYSIYLYFVFIFLFSVSYFDFYVAV